MRSQPTSDDAFLSRPQLYGGFGGFPRGAPSTEGKVFYNRSQRMRMNMVSVCESLFIPWLFFIFVYASTSFAAHYRRPWLTWILDAVALVAVLVSGGFALRAMRKKVLPGERPEPNWLMFLFLTMLVGWICGVVFGNLNYWTNLQPYYDYNNLNEYSDVTPATVRGQQLMDAGRIRFTNATRLDLRKSMGFKNLDTFCVAPISITGTSAGTLLPLDSYDFWAVGLGCCSSNSDDFHCGEYNNPSAKSGLRLMDDYQRAYFRLAVQQAEAAYNIRAGHPIFLYWMQNPQTEINAYQDDGYKYFLLGVFSFFAYQLFIVVASTIIVSKAGA
mmetsp:Transcript_73441/g.165043  ORF Transcript_73441/g.165043 Transcript_73441/m.165043 type:complete len:329 (+) Transcript_73441:135-1121(+)